MTLTALVPTTTGPTPPHPSPTETAPPARRLPAGWPIAAAVAGYPLWWALGAGPLVLPATAGLLLWQLRGRRRLVTPPGFALWLAFLAVVCVSAVMLDVHAPGTLPVAGAGRFAAYALRLLGYASVGVVLLYVVNTSERELPRLRVVGWLAQLALWTIALGLLSLALPRGGFRTPLGRLLPAGLDLVPGGRANLAQLQPVLGVYAPRPAAPFAYTNSWGCALALLLVWLVVAGWAGSRRRQLATAAVLAVSVVPIVYSLNRGMWIGLGLAVAYVAVRLAARGRLLALGALALTLGIGTAAFVASPLQTLVTERVAHGHSNEIRADLAGQALRAAERSPLLGYGSTRKVLGSGASITIGSTGSCPKCGNADIGSTGQYFLLLVSQGLLGTGLYVAYLLRAVWAYRRDASPVGLAGTLVVLLMLFFGLAYTALDVPLLVTFLSLGLLQRNAVLRDGGPA